MDLIEVRARDCACPGGPHAGGDIVSLRPHLSLAGGLAAQGDIIAAAGDGTTLMQRWLVSYVTHGAVGWNLIDEHGKDVPFDVAALLADYSFALPVAEKADELYSPSVIDPLTRRLGKTSRTGQTTASTSPRAQSIRKRRGSSSPATSGASMRLTG